MWWGIIAFMAFGAIFGCGRVVRLDDYGEPAATGGGSGGVGIEMGDVEKGDGDGGAGTGWGDDGACPGGGVPRDETCASSADEDCNGVDCVVWGQSLRVSSPTSRVKADSHGNLYVFGDSGSTADFGGGPLVPVGGYDLFLAKFDAAGQHIWSRRFGDMEDQSATDLALDASGNVLLGGSFRGALDFGAGVFIASSGDFDEDAYVAKLDTNGNALWARRFGDAEADQAVYALGATSDGDVIVAGDFAGAVDLGGGTLTAAGTSPARDIFVGRLGASDGHHLWSTRLGNDGWQSVVDLAVDAWDDITFTGTLRGAVDFGGLSLTATGMDIYVARFDGDGAVTCASLLPSGDGDSPLAIGVDPGGEALLAGYYSGTVDFGGPQLSSQGAQDVFLTKRDRLCQPVWSRSFGSQGNEYAADLAITAAGETYLTLSAQGTLDVGGGPLAGVGNADAVLAKYDAGGVHVWSRLFGDPYQQDFPHVATAGVTAVMTFVNTGVVDLGYGETQSGIVFAAFAP
jgi:hypothetical protein